MVPGELKYTKTHEWVKIEGSVATIGITDHAQDSLGDITFVELPQVGSDLQKGKECGVIESVKAASDIYSPLSGKIIEINENLNSTPEDINNSPYEKGWIYKLDNINSAETNDLMDSNKYEAFLESEQ